MKGRPMKRFALTAVLLVALSGCAKTATVPHPGAINQFDSSTYDVLLTSHTVIEDTKNTLANGAFPVNIAAGVKVALNGLIEAYNVLNVSYKTYHKAAVAGAATQEQIDNVTAAQMKLNTASSALVAAKGGK